MCDALSSNAPFDLFLFHNIKGGYCSLNMERISFFFVHQKLKDSSNIRRWANSAYTTWFDLHGVEHSFQIPLFWLRIAFGHPRRVYLSLLGWLVQKIILDTWLRKGKILKKILLTHWQRIERNLFWNCFPWLSMDASESDIVVWEEKKIQTLISKLSTWFYWSHFRIECKFITHSFHLAFEADLEPSYSVSLLNS